MVSKAAKEIYFIFDRLNEYLTSDEQNPTQVPISTIRGIIEKELTYDPKTINAYFGMIERWELGISKGGKILTINWNKIEKLKQEIIEGKTPDELIAAMVSRLK